MSDKGVCRTALATPGLLIIIYRKCKIFIVTLLSLCDPCQPLHPSHPNLNMNVIFAPCQFATQPDSSRPGNRILLTTSTLFPLEGTFVHLCKCHVCRYLPLLQQGRLGHFTSSHAARYIDHGSHLDETYFYHVMLVSQSCSMSRSC